MYQEEEETNQNEYEKFDALSAYAQRQKLNDLSKTYNIINPETGKKISISTINTCPKTSNTKALTMKDVYIYNFDVSGNYLADQKVQQGGQIQGGMIHLPPDFVQQLAEAIKLSKQPNIQNDLDEEANFDEPEEEDFNQEYAKSEDIQNVTGVIQQVSNQLNDYVNPYRNKTQEEIIKEYEKIGMLYYDNLNESTKDELGERLNFIKKIEEQSKALAQYKMNNPPYIQKDFDRATFDMFTKDNVTSKGIPLSKTYKFIQKIPDINIKFDAKTGFYKCNQDNETYIAKNYKFANKWASLGGFHMDELRELRKMAIKQNSLNDKFYPIFKARKL